MTPTRRLLDVTADLTVEVDGVPGAVRVTGDGARLTVAVADAATAAVGDASAFSLLRAAALSDAGESGLAVAAFQKLGEPHDIGHAIHLARHFIRSGQAAAGILQRAVG